MSADPETPDVRPMLFAQPIYAPYPGLRPFQPHESEIFFGRDQHVADMLTIIENRRFLAVVGPSGSGKSSLVLAGLIPALRRGELLTATSGDWRFVIMRPGDAPYRNLANAAQTNLWPDDAAHQFHDGDVGLTELVLRGSPAALVETVRDAGVPPNANVLLLVDQFEELFRFRSDDGEGGAAAARRRDDAATFVQLLLDSSRQTRCPIYVMLTMRTDFLGDCDVFDGLPQAINHSQYLTPRLNLRQLGEAIEKPLQKSMFRGAVAPDVVQRILNDVGTARDELPIVQHALFRTWQERKRTHPDEDVVCLGLADYESVGGLKHALSAHADEVLGEMVEAGDDQLVRKVFVALCTRGPNGQQVRRPVTIGQIADESNCSADGVTRVVEAFRREDRCFIMPPPGRKLIADTKIDISHESLLREWKKLGEWVERESRSAATFIRLRDAAFRWPDEEGLLRDPALMMALNWRREEQPCDGWAARYGGGLTRALEYLQQSEEERERVTRESEEARQRELTSAHEHATQQAATARRLLISTIVMAVLFVCAIGAFFYAMHQTSRLSATSRDRDDIKKQKSQLEVDKENGLRVLRDLDAKAQALRTYNESLAALGPASGTMMRAADGSVAIEFRESDVSPDAVIPLIGRLGEVRSLNLSHTRVSDNALAEIAKLRGLRSLDLSFTDITNQGITSIARMPQLTNLSVKDTLLTEPAVDELAKLANLKTLDVSHNRLNPQLVKTLRGKLKGCAITYEGDPLLEALSSFHGNWARAIDAVGGFKMGPRISFRKSPIGDGGLRALAAMPHLEALSFDECSHITNNGMRYLAKIPSLEEVALAKCAVSDPGVKWLAGAPRLKVLLLNLAVTDEALDAIGHAGGLENLEISGLGQSITDKGVASLVQLSHLETLDLSFTNVGADSLKTIAHLGHLRKLVLVYDKYVPGPAYSVLVNLRQLRSLRLDADGLRDDDLQFLEHLTQLRELNLEANDLSKARIQELAKKLPMTRIIFDGAVVKANDADAEKQ